MTKRLRYASSPGNTTFNIDDLVHTIGRNVSTNPRALGALSRLNKAPQSTMMQALRKSHKFCRSRLHGTFCYNHSRPLGFAGSDPPA